LCDKKNNQVKANNFVDALSRRHALLKTLRIIFLGFKHIKELYRENLDFYTISQEC